MKIRALGALSHADGPIDRQTDITELIVALRKFANAPKKKSAFEIIKRGTPVR